MTATLAPTPTVDFAATPLSWEAWCQQVYAQRWQAAHTVLSSSWVHPLPKAAQKALAQALHTLAVHPKGPFTPLLQEWTHQVLRLALPTPPSEWQQWASDVTHLAPSQLWLGWQAEGADLSAHGYGSPFTLSVLDADSPQWWWTSLRGWIYEQTASNEAWVELASLLRLCGPGVAPYWAALNQWLNPNSTVSAVAPLVVQASQRWGWVLPNMPLPPSGPVNETALAEALHLAETTFKAPLAFEAPLLTLTDPLASTLNQGWLISARTMAPQPAPKDAPLMDRLLSATQEPNRPTLIMAAGWQALWQAQPHQTQAIEGLMMKSMDVAAVHRLLQTV